MEYIDIKITKPLHGTFCYIRDMYIKRAWREKKDLRITIPYGTAVISPARWMKGAKKITKVFNYPDNPMILYGNYVPVKLEGERTTRLRNELTMPHTSESD